MPMIFQLHQPFALNEKGRRSNNEDSVFPKKGFATTQDRAFLVCDGVGGQAKGEIASKIVSEIFGDALRQTKASEHHYIEAVLQQVEDELQYYTQAHAESVGMATTLTMVHFHDNGVSVAHVGDSRIYQIRNGQIIYKSEDHSFVNELVRAGVITHEQAATHPQRNVITRAIQGNEKRTSSDVYILQNVAPNDYFFLCTDGILESVNDATLLHILTTPLSNEEKTDEILRLCEANSRDNFSCYLLQVEDCQGSPDYAYEQPSFLNATVAATIPPTQTQPYYEQYDEEPATSFHQKYAPSQPEPEVVPTYTPLNAHENTSPNVYENTPPVRPVETAQSSVSTKSNSSAKWVVGSFIFMAMAGGGTWYFLQQNNKDIPLQPSVETTPAATYSTPIPPVVVDTPVVNTTETTPIPVVSEKQKPVEEPPKKEVDKKHKDVKHTETKPVSKTETPKEVKKEEKPEEKKEIKKEPNLQNEEEDKPLGNQTKQVKADNQNAKTITNKTSQAIQPIQKKDNK
jgi:serine/threonine protein phosphatase PrpC